MKRQIAIVIGVGSMLAGSVVLPLTGCANRGIGPQGGPKDTIGPQIVKMSVENGARNVKSQEMVIHMNEYVTIDGGTDKIMVSPPQQRPPEIKAVGKKIEIKFKEPLKDNTTYTIDFGDQIVDNNEHNPLHDFSYSFSTGPEIDSLEVYGTLINAEDLNPVSGIVIGLHEQLDDSALYTTPFTRIGRTDAEGEFAIRNVKEGTYRLYGLADMSRDYVFQPGEAIAVADDMVSPYISHEVEKDTIGDSVVTMEYFYYEPSDLLLKLYKEDYERLYLQRALRKDRERIDLIFAGSQPTMPTITGLRLERDSLGNDPQWVDVATHSIRQISPRRDTVTLWLSDSAAIKIDTIRMAVTYTKTDSAYRPQQQCDTITAVYRAPIMSERAKKALAQKKERQGLAISSNASSRWNYYDTLRITSPTPIAHYVAEGIRLYQKQDTVETPMECRLVQHDSLGMDIEVEATWKPTMSYVLRIDSAAIGDIYGQYCHQAEYTIQVRSIEEYATMRVIVTPYRPEAMIQLLNSQDKPIREAKAEEKGTVMEHLEAGTYYMRIYMDSNGDGKWTTGEVKSHRQPEEVYYFPKKLTLRANWEFEEHFDWQAVELLRQKPAAIRKDVGK